MRNWNPLAISAVITVAVCLIADWLATVYVSTLSRENYTDVLVLVYNDTRRPGTILGLVSIIGLIYLARSSVASQVLVGVVLGAGIGNVIAFQIFSKGTPDYISFYAWADVDLFVNISDILLVVMITPCLYFLPRDVQRRDRERKARKLDASLEM